MKPTGRTMTLRGQIQDAEFDTWNTKNILDYANVLDISKAWRVQYYMAWLGSYPSRDNPGTGVEWAIHGFLSTDDLTVYESNADDNRQIGWSNQAYNSGGKTAGAYADGLMNESYIIDPDHIVQKRLDINFLPFGGSDFEALFVDINFIVYLEEVQITPNESIISTIKQSAQNIDA
jgi:hypothetical protein